MRHLVKIIPHIVERVCICFREAAFENAKTDLHPRDGRDDFMRDIQAQANVTTAEHLASVRLESPDLFHYPYAVMTGEGAFDATSLAGNLVGSVLRDAARLGVPSLVIAGRVTAEARRAAEEMGSHVVSLTEQFGRERALSDTAACVEAATAAFLAPAGEG